MIRFLYPTGGNTLTQVKSVLSGDEYPIHSIPEFEPTVIVDVGANIGAAALYFAKHYPNAQIYCYEPSEENFALLEHNTASIANVRSFKFGLSDANTIARLFQGRDQCLQHSIYKSIEVSDASRCVTLRRVSQAFAREGITPSILKLDSEGCEVQTLRDLNGTLDRVDLIYVEYHSESDRREIDALLSPYFFLTYASIQFIHRGILAYLSKSLANQHPDLVRWEIKRQLDHS